RRRGRRPRPRWPHALAPRTHLRSSARGYLDQKRTTTPPVSSNWWTQFWQKPKGSQKSEPLSWRYVGVYFACSRAPSRFDGSHLRPAPSPSDRCVSVSMSVELKIEAPAPTVRNGR